MPSDRPAKSAPGGEPARTRHVTAPAKVNLGLRILGRRADGYHLLESLFAPLDVCDDVSVTLRPGETSDVRITIEHAVGGPVVPADDRNLAVRAAWAFLEAAGLEARVEIVLEKRIPAAAGLGGGSSDAGAVLRALAALSPGSLPAAELARIALGLGADVRFFLDPRPALVTGIGERIEPVAGLPRLPLVLVNPGISLATADVYAAWDALEGALTPAPPGSTMRALSDFLASDPSDPATGAGRLAALLTNDLEAAAVRLCPPVGRLRRSLEAEGAVAVGMSGSGATVFGVFESAEAAARARDGIASRADGWIHLAVTGGPG